MTPIGFQELGVSLRQRPGAQFWISTRLLGSDCPIERPRPQMSEDGAESLRAAGSAESGIWLAYDPIWAPSDSAIAFGAFQLGEEGIRVVSLSSGEERLLAAFPLRGARPGSLDPELRDWRPDGERIAYLSEVAGESTEAWEYDLIADSTRPLFEAAGDVADLRYAPSSEWIAYEVVTAGLSDVYLRAYPEMTPVVRVTSGGGRWPRWNRDGRALFYLDSDGGVVSRTVGRGANASLGPPEVVLRPEQIGSGVPQQFEVSPDGQRFLFSLRQPETSLSLVLDWPRLLDGR